MRELNVVSETRILSEHIRQGLGAACMVDPAAESAAPKERAAPCMVCGTRNHMHARSLDSCRHAIEPLLDLAAMPSNLCQFVGKYAYIQ